MGVAAKAFGVGAVILGVIVCGSGIIIHQVIPGIVKDQLKKAVIIDAPSSTFYDSFVRPTDKVDVFMTYYLFNITNAADLQNGALLKLSQVGPYVYKERQSKPEENVTWHPNATKSYVYKTEYDFQPQLSAGTEGDPITIADVGVLAAFKQFSQFNTLLMDLALTRFQTNIDKYNITTMFVQHTVKDILWGYNDSLAVMLSGLDEPLQIALQSNESLHSGGKLSASYTGGNASKWQPAVPENRPGEMTMWEGMTHLPYWGDSYANMINGTDATSFHPGLEEGESLHAFVDSLYRSALLTNVGGQKEDYEGVTLLRLVLDPSTLESADTNPDNAAFYIQYSGIQPAPPDVKPPIYFSKPHFLDANRSNVNIDWTALGYAAAGPTDDELRPTYETFLDAEPHTGQLFRVHKRIQVNAEIQPIMYRPIGKVNSTALSITKGLTPTFLPIMWIDEHMSLPSNLVSDFKSDVLLPLYLGIYGGVVAAVVGALLVLLGVVCFVKCGPKGSKSEESLLREEYAEYATTVNKTGV